MTSPSDRLADAAGVTRSACVIDVESGSPDSNRPTDTNFADDFGPEYDGTR